MGVENKDTGFPMDTAHDSPSDIDDGFQDFLDEDAETETMRIQEIVARERRMRTLGIRDGVEMGKHETLQAGFDEGFALGAIRSCRFARLRGALEASRFCGLFDETIMTQVNDCLSRLRTLEIDTRDHGEEVVQEGSENAEEQAKRLLRNIRVDMTSSFK
ncbi:hypothetical protein PsorP6_010444 [Peronosclerospora sorghi]|uniref:Uncharacterized protein n=1 Tax=Peronosclerospora sorghi TaxID=230839 RepID=A0ACC0VX76_9STRA|nr:hypothetical protein PsorP6_010444 [Peronosclerospora sorghi]